MPRLRRTGPVRNWDGLFGSPRDAKPPVGGPPPEPGHRPPASSVTRGVDLGYRVIEEYMRQGEAFARSNGSTRGTSAPSAADPRKLTERMVEYASDLAAAWLEFVQMTMPAPPASQTSPRPATEPGGFDIGRAAPTPADPAAVRTEAYVPELPWGTSIEMASKRRVEVTLDLKPEAGGALLRAHDLRARDPEIPRIRGISVTASAPDRRVLLRIDVPDDQPPGTYTGVIVEDASNLPRGTLAVRIFE